MALELPASTILADKPSARGGKKDHNNFLCTKDFINVPRDGSGFRSWDEAQARLKKIGATDCTPEDVLLAEEANCLRHKLWQKGRSVEAECVYKLRGDWSDPR